MKITSLQKKTKDCFKDFYYRDSRFDTWLPKNQPAQSGEITVLQNKKEMTFLEMAQEYFGTTDIEELKKHALTLPMVEEMIAKHKSELGVTGWGNFFFMENKDGSVSVGSVARVERAWFAYVYRLGDYYRWSADNRLLVRNLGTLESSGPLTLEARITSLEAFEKRVRGFLILD